MSDTTIGRAELRRLLEEHSIAPSRALGQNFVVDPNTIDRIVRLSGVGTGDAVVEIGAGLGALTLALSRTGATVAAIELDRRILPLLRARVGGAATVIEADALRVDLADVTGLAADSRPATLVANLPYNIATPLVLRVLEDFPVFGRLFVMVQREVGERLAAVPGSKSYGGVSARIAYFARARVVGRVSAEVFHPRPRVESALVEITRREVPAVPCDVAGYPEICRVIRAGFGTRRKMLRRSLAGLVDEEGFARAGVEPTDRAESLDIESWGKLAQWAKQPTPS